MGIDIKNPKKKSAFRRLLALAWGEWRLFAIGSVFLAISSAAMLSFPQVIRQIIDEALVAKDAATINHIALIALGVFAAQSIAGAVRYACFTLAGEKIVVRLRRNLFSHILNQDVSFFDMEKTGELQSRLFADAAVLQNAVSVNISMVLRNFVGAIGGLGMLIYTSPNLSIALMACIPPVAVGVAIFGKKIRNFSRQHQDALAISGGVANESISGLRIVRAFGQEALEVKRYSKALDESFSISKRKIRSISIFTFIFSLFGLSAIVGVLWYGSLLVVSGEFSIGSLTSFMLYALSVAVSVGALGSLWTDFMSASGASHRIFAILDKPVGATTFGEDVLDDFRGEIVFQNVTFSYPSRKNMTVIDDMSFKIASGEIVAVVGPSGGGKSTIAGLIARFYDPDEGFVKIDGQELQTLQPEVFRRGFGIVPQEPILFSVSIEENIRFGNPAATKSEVKAAAKLANAEEFITSFPEGYNTLVGERGVQLSGGQRQRIAIARAAVRNPKILILDEATSALDSKSEALVQEALERLMVGRTTLIIAHRLSTVKKANRIFVLDHGKIVQMGSHEALLADQDGLYRQLIEQQLEG